MYSYLSTPVLPPDNFQHSEVVATISAAKEKQMDNATSICCGNCKLG
jgi:hypothetical protein